MRVAYGLAKECCGEHSNIPCVSISCSTCPLVIFSNVSTAALLSCLQEMIHQIEDLIFCTQLICKKGLGKKNYSVLYFFLSAF